ncbi:MAG TPA: hypothetical protein VFT45_08025 [Longimicrobium sp.]|nr:hypothetical protein [Longimicrobium sp.]
MLLRHHFVRPFAACALLVTAAACGDGGGGPTDPPGEGEIRVTVSMDGPVPDRDGVKVWVGSVLGGTISTGTVTFPGLPAGTHTVQLQNVSRNCKPSRETTGQVVVAAGQTTTFEVHLSCPGTGLAYVDGHGTADLRIRYPWSEQGEVLASGVMYAIPAWSPDRYSLVFAREEGSMAAIWKMDVETGVKTRLGGGGARSSYYPDWSPDGARIAYVGLTAELRGELRVMNADGSGDGPLMAQGQPVPGLTPAWSPDGTRIAYRVYRDGTTHLYVVAADGLTAPVALNVSTGDDTTISWSPDGEWLVYSAGQDVHVVRPDGSGHRNVTPTVGLPEEYPTFRGNGRIGFSASLSASGTDAWDIALDGTGRTNLTNTPTEAERHPAWQ